MTEYHIHDGPCRKELLKAYGGKAHVEFTVSDGKRKVSCLVLWAETKPEPGKLDQIALTLQPDYAVFGTKIEAVYRTNSRIGTWKIKK